METPTEICCGFVTSEAPPPQETFSLLHCGAPVASVFGTPRHGSGGAAGGAGWDVGLDSGAGVKNRTG